MITDVPLKLIQWLYNQDKDKKFEIQEHKEKRSLDANAYYWVLVNKIAEALRQTKEFVHLCMLKQYGETYAVLLPADKDITGLIKYYELESTIKRGNQLFNSYKAYLPSSEMNTKQMSVLIDGVVYEAQSMGIETMTPDELEKIKTNWG